MRAAWFVLLAACGGGAVGDLEPEDVTGVPDGDASGTAASGNYELELYTRSCVGECPVLEVGIGVVSLCDIGEVDYPEIDVTQTDGHLDMKTYGLFPDRLEGGLHADNTFVVGGWGTQYGATIVVRADGTVAGDTITGTAETRQYGSYDGTDFDCTIVHDLTGTRTGPSTTEKGVIHARATRTAAPPSSTVTSSSSSGMRPARARGSSMRAGDPGCSRAGQPRSSRKLVRHSVTASRRATDAAARAAARHGSESPITSTSTNASIAAGTCCASTVTPTGGRPTRVMKRCTIVGSASLAATAVR